MRPKKRGIPLIRPAISWAKVAFGGSQFVSFQKKQTVSVLGVGCVLLLTWKNDWLVLSALVLVVGCLRNGC